MPRQHKDDVLITDEIKNAINQFLKDYNIPLYQMALKIGFSRSGMYRWLDGKGASISRDNWNMIYPYIKSYLPEGKYGMIEKQIRVSGHYVKQVGNGNTANIESNLIQQKIKSVMLNTELSPDEKLKFIKILIGE